MRMRTWMAVAIAGAAVACGQEPTRPPGPTPARPSLQQRGPIDRFDGERTPFQRSLMRAIAERQAAGLPVPASVSFTYQEEPAAAKAPAPGAVLRLEQAPPLPEKKISARTTIEFTNPTEAGQDVWPNLVVRGEVPPGGTGFVKPGDYTDLVKQKAREQYPDAWTNVDYETGPRTYTVTEDFVASNPDQAPTPMGLQDQTLNGVTSADQLLMGFTVLGPNIDYHLAFDVSICVFWFFGCVAEVELVDFWAGFKLDWTIGTRLPMALSVATTETVKEGSTFSPTTAAGGRNWSAADYEQAGVAPEDGNEFILKFVFKVGVFVEVVGVDVIDLGVDVDLDRASSFATPLGAGAMFDLPSINVSVWSKDIGVAAADVGLVLTPQAGSDKFTADWLVSGEGGGSGAVTYTTSDQPVSLGSLQALDGPGNATVQLSNFRYYFNQFGLDLGIYFYLSVLGYGGTWTVPITDFDLSALTGGLYIKPHSGTPGTIALQVPIENVAPTVTLSRSGTVLVNGRPTFLAQPGQPVVFTGEASDPGRDDLTLTWDWDDGAPSPDVTTTYPVPHHVTESQTHGFSNGCLYQVTLKAVDDDQAAGQDQVPVAVTGSTGNRARLEGYWQHQFGRMGQTDFDDAGLNCYLAIINHFSTVADLLWDAPSIRRAHAILWPQLGGSNPLGQFDRELLVVWLNFAHGAIGYTQLVDANEDGRAETPFVSVMRTAEAMRRNPSATPSLIRMYTRILHSISVAAS